MPLTPFVDRYRIVHLLGVGGMGIVYRAEDVTLRRPVALKFLAPEIALDDEYRARFLREARVAASFNHPNTCVVYEVGELEAAVALPDADTIARPGTLFIAMELVEGDTLATKLAESGPFEVAAAIEIALQVADGLAEAHSKGIIHRDLKPQNVMMTPKGRLKIVDFGLAKPIKPVQGELTSTSEMISADIGVSQLLGTCAYMSPEQVTGKTLDARSDVFALGIMLYEMVSGRLPFRGESTTETLAKILESEPLPLLEEEPASKALAQLIGRCLEKSPVNRYRDAREVLEELRQAKQLITADAPASPGATDRVAPVIASFRTRLIVSAAVPLVLLAAYPIVRSVATGTPPANTSGPSDNPPEALPPPDSDAKPIVSPPLDTDTTPKAPAVQPEKSASVPPPPKSKEPAKAPQPVSSSPTESLTISSTAPASVTIDGKPVGTTAVTVETSATGSLSVVSEFWVEVSLDGGAVEQTPIHFASLAAGPHTVRASRPGYVTEVKEVFIEESKAASLRITLKKEP